MEWWHVYLFTRLTGINVMFGVLVVVSGLFALGTGIGWTIADFNVKDMDSNEQGWEPWQKAWRAIFKVALPVFLFSLAGTIAVPSQEQAAAIFLLPKLAHSDFAKEAQQIPTDTAKLIRMKLEAWINDMEPKKAEKK